MEKKVYKCLVASPGDTLTEREICTKIFDEINSSIGEQFEFIIEKRMWEHNTRPSFGAYSQAVISEQLGDDYDIFVGILYKKYGTETKAAASGTEEEFNNAYKRIANKEKVEIMFYFNDEPVKISEINTDEINKISSFKKRVADLGGYYWNYNGSSDFEKVFRKQLTQYFLQLYKQDVTASTKFNVQIEVLRAKFKERLDKSLKAFDSQPIIWVDPIISNTREISHNPDENYAKRVEVSEIINNPESLIIASPPQFGLTSLAHFMVSQAWEAGNLWIYLDSNTTKGHNIHNAAIREAESLGFKITDVKVIILDSWTDYEIDSYKKVKNLCESYKDTPLIIMQTVDGQKILSEPNDIKIKRNFRHLHLLALPRNQIRKVVSEYNRAKEIGSDDKVLEKVLSDLEVLNIHRTPMNCFTLLKVAEKYFDESPINRTDMIEKVLFVLFNMDGIPRYRSKPDLKDCEYVLGRYCEIMIRSDKYCFSRDEFIKCIRSFCEEKLIELEVDTVFDTLQVNNIIVWHENGFAFRSSYWLYYFAAKRMHNDENFSKYIFSSKKYIAFPEIIEFYTGIDRNKGNALEILTRDIKETCDIVTSKVRLSESMIPFSLIQWHPTEPQIQNLQQKLGEDVIQSGLPEEVKDQYADRSYNQIRPYHQSIQTIFSEYSLLNLMQNIRATARALRNSDYVKPDIKRESLKEILRSWEQISKVLLALTPILAERGGANFEGQSFLLNGDFGDTPEKRANMIIQVNMTNVVGFFKDDLYSSKLGPLLFEHFGLETNAIRKHQIALLLIFCRPKDWKKHIENYIVSLNKNSFYLYDAYNALQSKYNFDFIAPEERNDLSYLIKICFVKHESGSAKPGLHEIKNVKLKKA